MDNELKPPQESIVPDPITGSTMSVITYGENFCMLIPHQGRQLTEQEANAFRETMGILTQTSPTTWKWDRKKSNL